jgi:hypothetical protein
MRPLGWYGRSFCLLCPELRPTPIIFHRFLLRYTYVCTHVCMSVTFWSAIAISLLRFGICRPLSFTDIFSSNGRSSDSHVARKVQDNIVYIDSRGRCRWFPRTSSRRRYYGGLRALVLHFLLWYKSLTVTLKETVNRELHLAAADLLKNGSYFRVVSLFILTVISSCATHVPERATATRAFWTLEN